MARNTQRKKQFAGRDKSWMNFNRRVLEEAEDDSNPILERVKFLAITGSNLDEYVEIRLAGLLQRTEDGHTEPGYDGLPPQESLEVLTREMHDFVAAQYRCWNEQLLPELRQHGIRLLQWEELSEEQRKTGPDLLPEGSGPAADPDHDRSGAPLSQSAQSGALPGAFAAAKAAQLRAGSAWSVDRSSRVAEVCAPG
jgi:polyphosphate kinase